MSTNPWGAPAALPKKTSNPATSSNGPAPAKPGGFDSVQNADPYSFGTPVGISEYKMEHFVGELVMLEPEEYIESMMTSVSKEPTDAFRIRLVCLTGEYADEVFPGMMVFQVALKNELKRTYRGPNRWLVARVEMGAAKPGWNAPYLFSPPSEDDVALAQKWIAAQSK